MGEASQPLNRTKVYLLNDDGQWDDRGTGHAEIQYMPAEDAAFIIVMSEENAETSLLQTKIHMQDIYQRQQDTIISWNEPDTGVDYALSFQNPDGCTELGILVDAGGDYVLGGVARWDLSGWQARRRHKESRECMSNASSVVHKLGCTRIFY